MAQAAHLEAIRAARCALLAVRLTDTDGVAAEQALDTLVQALLPDRHRQPDPASGLPRYRERNGAARLADAGSEFIRCGYPPSHRS